MPVLPCAEAMAHLKGQLVDAVSVPAAKNELFVVPRITREMLLSSSPAQPLPRVTVSEFTYGFVLDLSIVREEEKLASSVLSSWLVAMSPAPVDVSDERTYAKSVMSSVSRLRVREAKLKKSSERAAGYAALTAFRNTQYVLPTPSCHSPAQSQNLSSLDSHSSPLLHATSTQQISPTPGNDDNLESMRDRLAKTQEKLRNARKKKFT